MFEDFENVTQQNDAEIENTASTFNIMNDISVEKNASVFDFLSDSDIGKNTSALDALRNALFEVLGISDNDSNNDIVKQPAEVYNYLNGLEEYGDVYVTGKPFETAANLDYFQGDNPYGALGCCGLVSSSNFLNMCGIEATEDEIVGFALENDLCNYGWFTPPESVGGTNDMQIEAVIEAHGVPVSVYEIGHGGSVEDIADAIDEGRAVTIGVNAGYLWNDASAIYNGHANHQITVTGAVRDNDGSVVGLVICDSGRGLESDACRVVSMEELTMCYETVPGATAIISDGSVR